jgi:hypothetical protein
MARPLSVPVRVLNRWVYIAILLLLLPGSSPGSPLSGGAGVDYSSGPDGQSMKSGVAFASLALAGADITLAGARYDDNEIGSGVTGIGSAGFPLSPATKLRVTGARSIGDGTYRGWRVKAGPEWALPGGPTLGLFYTHTSDNSPSASDIASGELNVPLQSALAAQGSLTYGSLPDGLNTTQAGLGLRVNPSKRFLLSAEFGIGRNVIGGLESGVPGSGSGRVHTGGSTKRSTGGSAGTTSSSDLVSSLQLGCRILIP